MGGSRIFLPEYHLEMTFRNACRDQSCNDTHFLMPATLLVISSILYWMMYLSNNVLEQALLTESCSSNDTNSMSLVSRNS